VVSTVLCCGAKHSAYSIRANARASEVMTAAPHSSSGVHHHGSQDTIVLALRGIGAIVTDAGKTKQYLSPGDWALIPGGCDHQEANEGDEEVVWAIIRGGNEPQVVNLDGWR
jgi:uncharacterized RmlC-like cupin family protein